MNYHPIQLKFAHFINNPVLSDIKLKATLFDHFDDNKIVINGNDDNDIKDENKNDKSNEPTIITSLDDDDNNDNNFDIAIDSDSDNDNIHHSKQSSIQSIINKNEIFCHWDILRCRCIIFDLIYHSINQNKINQLKLNGIYFDSKTNIIFINSSSKALMIIIKYLYTGIIKTNEYQNDMNTAKHLIHLSALLELDEFNIELCGKFLKSRKKLRNLNKSRIINCNKFNYLKLKHFDYKNWSSNNLNSFLNSNVLYLRLPSNYIYGKQMKSRQLIAICGKIFEISKIIYVSVSLYFSAMFATSSWKESILDINNIIEIKQVSIPDFTKLQHFLYSFNMDCYLNSNKLNQKLIDSDFINDNNDIKCKKVLCHSCVSGLHLSIFFGISLLRKCLFEIIDKYYLCNNTLFAFWNLGFKYIELNDINEICLNYFQLNFGNLSLNKIIFNSLTKNMIKSGLSNGCIQVNTSYMIKVLLEWAQYHSTNILELLPPNTLFNQSNKSYVLLNRRAANLQHLLRL